MRGQYRARNLVVMTLVDAQQAIVTDRYAVYMANHH